MLKTSLSIALFVSSVAVNAATVDELALEPCINGDVSALGTHVQQVDEDIARAIGQSNRYDDLALEPCINGDVSALGTHVQQVDEDIARAIDRLSPYDELALEPCINGDVSALGTSPDRVMLEAFAATGADE
jgi:hypothetical protein